MIRNENLRLATASAYREAGVADHAKGDPDKAIADFTVAIRLDPNVVEAYLLRSPIYQAMGDHDKGIDDWMEAVRLDPTLTKLKAMEYMHSESRREYEEATLEKLAALEEENL
jgi:tetratricopeptide (TPR) repeat protein